MTSLCQTLSYVCFFCHLCELLLQHCNFPLGLNKVLYVSIYLGYFTISRKEDRLKELEEALQTNFCLHKARQRSKDVFSPLTTVNSSSCFARRLK